MLFMALTVLPAVGWQSLFMTLGAAPRIAHSDHRHRKTNIGTLHRAPLPGNKPSTTIASMATAANRGVVNRHTGQPHRAAPDRRRPALARGRPPARPAPRPEHALAVLAGGRQSACGRRRRRTPSVTAPWRMALSPTSRAPRAGRWRRRGWRESAATAPGRRRQQQRALGNWPPRSWPSRLSTAYEHIETARAGQRHRVDARDLAEPRVRPRPPR